MVFPDHFKNHILPEKIHILNVSFLVPEMRREYGGCAGNIAYSLNLLGGDPLIMATVGEDFQPYAQRLQHYQLTPTHIRTVPSTYTAQAFITTDLDDNQITAFHPGAMNFSHENHIAEVSEKLTLAIISPDGRQGMLQHAAELYDAGIPFIFDPGQGLPMFNGVELLRFIEMADYVAVNDYEAQLIAERTQQSIAKLAERVKAWVVTLGAQGSVIYASGKQISIPAATPDKVVDPTGCGDAYRAGLLYGIAHDWDWQTTGRLAAAMGALKIAQRGAQNFFLEKDAIAERYYREFNQRIEL